MAYDTGRNPFNPLIVGSIAVIIALTVFLIFREGTPNQQAGIDSPPAVTTQTPPPGEPNPPPTTPNPPANQPAPKGSGTL